MKFSVGAQLCEHGSRKFRGGNCTVEMFLVEKLARALRHSSTFRNIFNLRHNLQRRLLHGCGVFRGAARYPDSIIRTSGRRQQIVMKFYFQRRVVVRLIRHSVTTNAIPMKLIRKKETNSSSHRDRHWIF